jgi:hypothetical protein
MAWAILGMGFVLAMMAMGIYARKNGVGRDRNRRG